MTKVSKNSSALFLVGSVKDNSITLVFLLKAETTNLDEKLSIKLFNGLSWTTEEVASLLAFKLTTTISENSSFIFWPKLKSPIFLSKLSNKLNFLSSILTIKKEEFKL